MSLEKVNAVLRLWQELTYWEQKGLLVVFTHQSVPTAPTTEVLPPLNVNEFLEVFLTQSLERSVRKTFRKKHTLSKVALLRVLITAHQNKTAYTVATLMETLIEQGHLSPVFAKRDNDNILRKALYDLNGRLQNYIRQLPPPWSSLKLEITRSGHICINVKANPA